MEENSQAGAPQDGNKKGLMALGIVVLLIAGGWFIYAQNKGPSGESVQEGIPVKAGVRIETPTTTLAANGDAITYFNGTIENPEVLNNVFELVLIADEYSESADRASVYAYLEAQGGHRARVEIATSSWSTSFTNIEGGRYKMYIFPGGGNEDARLAPVVAGLFDFVEPER